jgi:3D (Asp-Asp-Asp) domain-containing protein
MKISPSRERGIGASFGWVLATVLVVGCFSDGIARPALAGKTAADGPKSSDDTSVEIPGAFKDPSNAANTRASKNVQSRGARKSSGDVAIDPSKGISNPRQAVAAKSKIIKIPANLIAADQLHEFNATAYCLRGRTASGQQVRPGIIAADPRVLPIGTVVHLQAGEYTGVYTVLDTGGLIKGHLIDVYVPTRKEAMNFGRRRVRLKIIRGAAVRTDSIARSSDSAGQ